MYAGNSQTVPESFDDCVAQLEQCAFAGEIALNETQVRQLSGLVRREVRHPRPTKAMMGRLILLAVNCAYYHDQDFRFWAPFCNLLDIKERIEVAARWLGPKIEQALVRFEFLKETRTGPSRWVTPIKVEAGITRHDLQSFARILEALRDQFGWPYAASMRHGELRSYLEQNFQSTRLVRFLQDPDAGSPLTSQVCKLLSLKANGLLTSHDLAGLKGYRPGFWDELIPLLGTGSSDVIQKIAKLRPPRFFFDAVSAQLGVLFPQEQVEKRLYRIADQLVFESFFPVRNYADLTKQFSGTIGDEPFEVDGWVPSEDVRFALFAGNGTYCTRVYPITPGQYFLVSTDDSEPSTSIHLLTDFEYVNIQGNVLRFWQVDISANSDLSSIGYRRFGSETLLLQWKDHGRKLVGNADSLDVFVDELPGLVVRQLERFRSGNYALFFWDDGKRPCRLELDVAGTEHTITLPIKIPCRGRVWVENLWRSRGGR